MGNSKQSSWKKISKIAITAIAALLIVFIAGIVFFKFAPGYGFYVVKSGSMEPSIKPGDIIFTHQVSEVHKGDIVTFEIKDEVITHRIIAINGDKITTQGDANKVADTNPITMDNIKGTYLFQLPKIGWILNLTNSKSGWFIIVIIPTIILLLIICRDILKEAFKDDKKKAKNASNEIEENKETSSKIIAASEAAAAPAPVVQESAVVPQAAPVTQPSAAISPAITASPVGSAKNIGYVKAGTGKSSTRNVFLTIKKIIFIEK